MPYAQTLLVQFVVDLLYNKFYTKYTTKRTNGVGDLSRCIVG